MGYKKIIQFGNITEIYEYEKSINNSKRKRPLTALQKKRRKERRQSNPIRTKRSIQRTVKNFFRLCQHNVQHEDTHSVVFATLTFAEPYEITECYRRVSEFFRRLKKALNAQQIHSEISYIGVPELTKKEAIHFHLLLFNLSPQIVKNERNTRNIQRLYRSGYLDLRLAYDRHSKIAGYMAKYMAKNFQNPKFTAWRNYNSSRNVKKVRSYGSNSVLDDMDLTDLLVDTDTQCDYTSYKVPFLGTCIKKTYKKIK